MKDNIIKDKSLNFAIRIVNLNKYLTTEKKEFVLSNQLLRSGTSIGANISEADVAVSKNDFINKIGISLKEAKETEYWIELLYRTNFVSNSQYESLKSDIDELIKLLVAIKKSSEK